MQAGLATPLLAALLFGAVALGELAWPAPGASSAAAFRVPHGGGPGVAPPVPGRPAAEVGTILARPLFSVSRRPPPGNGGGNVDNTVPRLSGILVTDTLRRAVFEPPSGGKPVTIGVGGRAGPYTVRAIATTSVTVGATDGERILRPVPLTSDQETAANVPPSAPAAPHSFTGLQLLERFRGNAGSPGHAPSPIENLLQHMRQRG